MTQQLNLLDYISAQPRYPHAPAPGKTDTSQAAATNLGPGRCEDIRLLMLDLLREHGAMNYKEVCKMVEQIDGTPESTAQPRWSELKTMKRIRDTGIRRDRCAVMEVGLP